MTDIPTQLPPDRQPALRMAAMPADTNAYGNIFGGWIMSYVDLAGGITAAHRAQGRVATVAVNSFEFKRPVFVGDVVSFYAEVIRIGTTSLTVFVECYAERQWDAGRRITVKVTEATLSFVAVDANHQPRNVPPAPEQS